MNDDEATAALANLKQLVISTHVEMVRKAFSALAYFDGLWIEERAVKCLPELDLELVADEPNVQRSVAHRVTMEVFYCGLYEYCEEKPAVVEFSVEDDVPLWIEANAPVIMGANIEALEDLLPEYDPNPRRTLIEFHRLSDLDEILSLVRRPHGRHQRRVAEVAQFVNQRKATLSSPFLSNPHSLVPTQLGRIPSARALRAARAPSAGLVTNWSAPGHRSRGGSRQPRSRRCGSRRCAIRTGCSAACRGALVLTAPAGCARDRPPRNDRIRRKRRGCRMSRAGIHGACLRSCREDAVSATVRT